MDTTIFTDKVLAELEDKVYIALDEDTALYDAIAIKILDEWQYYLHCKEGGELDHEYIYDQIEDTFISEGALTFNIRHLAKKTFDLEELHYNLIGDKDENLF